MKKRILSLLLALAMVVGMIPATTLTANAATLPEITGLHRGVLADGESPAMVYWDAVNGVEKYEVKVTQGTATEIKMVYDSCASWTKIFCEARSIIKDETFTVEVTGGYSYGNRFIYETDTATIDIATERQPVNFWTIGRYSVVRGETYTENLWVDKKFDPDFYYAPYEIEAWDDVSGYPKFKLVDAPAWIQLWSNSQENGWFSEEVYMTFDPPADCTEGTYEFWIAAATSDTDGLLIPFKLPVGAYRGEDTQYWIQNMSIESPDDALVYWNIWKGVDAYEHLNATIIQGGTGNIYEGQTAASILKKQSSVTAGITYEVQPFAINLLNVDGQLVKRNDVIDIGRYRYQFSSKTITYRDPDTWANISNDIYYDENLKVYLDGKLQDVVVKESGEYKVKAAEWEFYGPWIYVYDEKPEINSVTVNGESVADGGTVTANNGTVTIKTNYDGLSDAMKDYGCSVKQLAVYYLNGEKITVAAPIPVDNGDGTYTKSYTRTLNPGDELRVESWLEVRWPDGSTDRVDEHTVTVSYANKQYIDYVDIVDIDLPEAGARPHMEYEILSGNLDAKKTKIEWFECDKNGSYVSTTPLADTDLYEKNTYYRVNVTVYPREDYVFDGRDLSAYINDSAVNYYYNNDGSVTMFAYYNVHEVDTKNTIDVFLNSKDFVTMKDGEYLAQSSDTPTTAAQSDNYMYYKDGVLYLNNYKRSVHLRYSEKHLEVDFSGDNAICGFESNYDDYDYTAIAFYGGADDYLDLNGLGRSSCTITAYAAFFNGGNYVLDDGTYVAFWWTNYVEVNGGADIKLNLSQYGPFSEADVTLCVNEGEVEFEDQGTWQSDWLLTDLTIANGTAYVKGSNKDEYALWDQVSDFNDYDYLLVQNKKIVTYKVVFIDDDNTVLDMVRVNEGETVAKPADPVKDGYTFLGWYTDDGELFDFNTPITENTYLTAKYASAAGNRLGDLTNDGIIDIADATMAFRAANGRVTLTNDQKAVADVNNDGIIDIADATMLFRFVNGRITTFG